MTIDGTRARLSVHAGRDDTVATNNDQAIEVSVDATFLIIAEDVGDSADTISTVGGAGGRS